MRAWLGESRYTSVLNNPAPDATSAELQGIAELLDGRKPKKVQGTVLLGEVDRSQNSNRLSKPVASHTPVDLEEHGVYDQVLAFVNAVRPDYQLKHWDHALLTDDPVLPKR